MTLPEKGSGITDEMVERAAKALAKLDGFDFDRSDSGARERWLTRARVAAKAMQEPERPSWEESTDA